MKIMRVSHSLITLLLVLAAVTAAAEEKLTLDQVIARHLASIGTPAARAAVKTRVAEGKSQYFELINPNFALEGKAAVVSEAEKVRLVLKYMNPQYFGEDMITDGDQVRVYGHPHRSPLAYFLYNRSSAVLTEGLLEGTLSTAWPLLDPNFRSAKLTYNGLAKINDEEYHEVRYQPRKRCDLDIRLYFHKEDFRHILTIVKYTIEPQLMRGPDVNVLPPDAGRNVPGLSGLTARTGPDVANANQRPLRYALVQRFSNFKEFDGLTLPTTYEIQYDTESGVARQYRRYINTFNRILNNVALDPRNFEMKKGPESEGAGRDVPAGKRH